MDKHIMLTGSGRGIGAATAQLIGDRDGVKLFAARRKDGDLSLTDGPARLWDTALSALDGRVDVLINNAGVFETNPLSNSDADWQDNWQRTLQINLMAAADLCRAFITHCQTHGHAGRIVNIASRSAYRGDSPDHIHYAASKGGLVAMTKSIARGYARDGITAFTICPGFTASGDIDAYMASRGGDAILADIPLGRVATAEEIGAIATWCALDAPDVMTGAVLDANGASYVR